MALIRYRNPIQQDLDRLFGTFFDSHTAQERPARRWVPAVDLVDEGDHYALTADVPGVSEKDVTIEVEDDVLRISGERRSEREESREGYYRVERASGAFSRSLRLPEGTDPQAIEARIEQDPTISQQLTLWRQGGSQVIRGSLLAIPVEQSLLYVSPLYLAAEKGSLPELKRVIVAFGNQIAMEETLDRSLQVVFGTRGAREAARAGVEAAAGRAPAGDAGGAVPASLAALTARASEHYARAQEFLRQGNWAGFGEELKKMEGVLKQLRDATR